MTPSDPSLAQVRDEVLSQLGLDQRVRQVEITQATTTVEVAALKEDLRATKTEILSAIEANKPPSPWPAVSALAAVLSVVLLIAGRLYGVA